MFDQAGRSAQHAAVNGRAGMVRGAHRKGRSLVAQRLGAGRERFLHQLQAGANHAAEVQAVRVEQIDRDRGSAIDDAGRQRVMAARRQQGQPTVNAEFFGLEIGVPDAECLGLGFGFDDRDAGP